MRPERFEAQQTQSLFRIQEAVFDQWLLMDEDVRQAFRDGPMREHPSGIIWPSVIVLPPERFEAAGIGRIRLTAYVYR